MQQTGSFIHNFYHYPDSLVRPLPSNLTCVIPKPPAFSEFLKSSFFPHNKMLCSCWLHCLCPGTCPASWGLRGKDLVFLQHWHMGITVTRPQKRLVFCVDHVWSQRSCHVWSSKAAMKMTLCDNPHSHFPPPHLDPFWHWQHQVERVW